MSNSAFVFIKPHAHTEGTIELVKKTFADKKIKILKEGVLEAGTIDEKKVCMLTAAPRPPFFQRSSDHHSCRPAA